MTVRVKLDLVIDKPELMEQHDTIYKAYVKSQGEQKRRLHGLMLLLTNILDEIDYQSGVSK